MKKRGLIVATIVMVLVLAVSLTTATYAWFSSQASATVDDLAITTKAADGLQIAMTNTKKSIADLQSGELLYENSKWIGETSTWGSYLGFANIEQDEWPDAVTNNSAGNAINYNTGTFKATADETAQTGKKYYLATSHTNLAAFATGVVYYELSGGTYSKTADETANSGKTYYTLSIGAFDKTKSLEEIVAQTSAAGFLKPTGYDSSITPTGFDTAKVNVDYFEFDMAITNVTDIYKLGMGIIVTATETSAGDQIYPGMVAASRIEVEFYKGSESTQTGKVDSKSIVELQPYGGYVLGANNKMSAPDDSKKDGNYKFPIEDSATPIDAATVWFVTVRIWIEGTDNECKNLTAGTGFTVEIEFVYSKDSAVDLAYDVDNTETNEYTVQFS